MTAGLPWPGIGSDPIRGSKFATLLLNFPRWVHRRVDRIVLGSDGTTRRSISFDLTVPEKREVRTPGEKVLVPLALIEKGALRNFSGADPDGHPMPILGAGDNALLTVELLQALVQPARDSHHVSRIIDGIVRFPRNGTGGERLIDAWETWLGQASFPPHFPESYLAQIDNMVKAFLENFLLVAELDESHLGKRCVLKVSYDRDLPVPVPGDNAVTMTFTLPDAGFAHSQHIEVDAPGLRMRWLEVIEFMREEAVDLVSDTVMTERSTAHVAFRPHDINSSAAVLFAVSPMRSGISGFTVTAAVAVLVFAVLVLVERADLADIVGTEFAIPSPSVSLLLVGPALFLSWMARSPEHRAVAVVLAPLRWVLLICTTVLVLAGFAVAVPLQPWAWSAAWDAVVVLSVLNVLLLIASSLNVLSGLISRALSVVRR